MTETEGKAKLQMSMDPNNLYREELITDFKVGRIRQLTPIRVDGGPDKNRKMVFIGETQVRISSNDIIPVQCDIPAKTLMEAIEKFPEAVHLQMERMVKEAQELKRKSESRIIVPGQ
ncbi:MAG: cytoplasmic protein [Deltaproteobacteria bacterium]|nr:cytoplasmic protein [Deltaproteobacteria bacterium]